MPQTEGNERKEEYLWEKRKTNRHETNIIRMAENERKTVILKKEWIIIDKE